MFWAQIPKMKIILVKNHYLVPQGIMNTRPEYNARGVVVFFSSKYTSTRAFALAFAKGRGRKSFRTTSGRRLISKSVKIL